MKIGLTLLGLPFVHNSKSVSRIQLKDKQMKNGSCEGSEFLSLRGTVLTGIRILQ